MNLSNAIYAVRWLVRDTFRQARASGIVALMLAVSAVCIAVCLSAGIEGATDLGGESEPREFLSPAHPGAADPARAAAEGLPVAGGHLTLAFGAVRVPLGRDGRDAVRFLQLLLAGGVADGLGILLALVWTAGFLPAFLEPSAASVLLAKPLPRGALLAGKYLGVLGVVAVQAALFVGGTWLALGVRTGVWEAAYLWSVPLLLVHFAIFFSASVLLAVWTRSTVACVLGSVLFWALCWGMNYGRHLVVTQPDASLLPGAARALVEAGYWLLPKPADLSVLLFDALQAGSYLDRTGPLREAASRPDFHPELSLLSSLAFLAATLLVAARELVGTEY
jgi:hypothetical protein